MQINEFEKQVQWKMNELKLNPSEAVWQRIESQIIKEKRRRWIIFFLSLLFCMLLYSGFRLWFSKNILPPQQRSSDSSIYVHNSTNTSFLQTIKNKSNNIKIDSIKTGLASQTNKKLFIRRPTVSKTSKKYLSGEKIKNIPDNILHTTEIIPEPEVFKKELFNENDSSDKIEINSTAQNIQPVNHVTNYKSQPDSAKDIVDSMSNPVALIPKKIEETKRKSSANIHADSNKTKNEISWNFGISFSTGISDAGNKFLGSQDKSLNALLYYSPGSAITPSPVASSLKPSLALITGLFAQKNISQKTIFTVELNYKMIGITNKTGTDSAGYYLSRNTVNAYHNYFHFIELPVSFQFKIASKNIPLFWSAGVSISQLVSSNALQFNNVAGYYYHDNSFFSKTQFGFSTGLFADLFSKQKTSILIGPYFYYGASKISNQGVYKDLHFTFIGLGSKILFRKK